MLYRLVDYYTTFTDCCLLAATITACGMTVKNSIKHTSKLIELYGKAGNYKLVNLISSFFHHKIMNPTMLHNTSSELDRKSKHKCQ